ncbi:class I SAM-dependent methyltransferase [Candidatus Parcubacteria bacterium]|nr:class I SAM-dependent methyltransferase [Patescibacteria group bacterium]MCG2686987.1 class I SAM-dependent methyltransferase [Candidatus Parcubacteria bacterium]
MNCKICNNPTRFLFNKKVLNKYDAEYFQCENCGFIQIKNPLWLNEAYKSAISSLDTGLVARNIWYSSFVEKIIIKYFNQNNKFIDYGGGYGLFVRLMRDKGFDYYRQDNYCQNLFAESFDIQDLNNDNQKFELLTAFELFEHLEEPISEIEKMLKFSDSILFSTELQLQNTEDLENWWYFSPESGQHISFYTKESLNFIAKKFNLNLSTNNKSIHILTKKSFETSPFEKEKTVIHILRKIAKLIFSHLDAPKKEIKSLTQEDYEKIKQLKTKL